MKKVKLLVILFFIITLIFSIFCTSSNAMQYAPVDAGDNVLAYIAVLPIAIVIMVAIFIYKRKKDDK